MDKPDNVPKQRAGSLTDSGSASNHYAAIDIGSNSFHMIIAEPEGNSIRKIDSLRVPVRLGSGLDNQKRIKPATERLALRTIGQFAQRLRDVPASNIRIVGTNTLRRARNAERFIQSCYGLLHKRIEIISGREEARLIYSAVAHGQPDPENQRLVVDIGGGSTELIIGQGFTPSIMESVNMGCVSFTQRFLADGKLGKDKLKNCVINAQLELQPVTQIYVDAKWDEVIGCSGTIKATSRVLKELGLTDGTITLAALADLQRYFIERAHIDNLDLGSISDDRKQVFAAGSQILYAVMKTLKIESMLASPVALREGLIFELIGRAQHQDIRTQTVDNLLSRYHIDRQQADQVESTAMRVFDLARKPWQLEQPADREMLRWSSLLHEIGLSVAHSQYHKHGYYLINHSDLLGFSKTEQAILALLVRYHRRKLDTSAYNGFSDEERGRLIKLQVLLRLAVLLHRARHTENLQLLDFSFSEDEITIQASDHWFKSHPLTSADLYQEAEHLDAAGYSLAMIRDE